MECGGEMNRLDLQRLVRPNILNLTPYRCARDDYSEGSSVYLGNGQDMTSIDILQ